MALGDYVKAPQLTVTVQASIQFNCLTDGHVVQGGPVTLVQGQTNYFALVCPGDGTRYLISVNAAGASATVQESG